MQAFHCHEGIPQDHVSNPATILKPELYLQGLKKRPCRKKSLKVIKVKKSTAFSAVQTFHCHEGTPQDHVSNPATILKPELYLQGLKKDLAGKNL